VCETSTVVANLADLVSDAARSRPRHPAVVTEARVTTWSEVEWQVRAVASGLIARGLAPGARVAIMQRNTLEFVTSYFGILRAGMVAVPLNTGYTTAEVGLMLGDVDVSLALADPDSREVLGQLDIDVVYTGTEDWRRFTVGSSPLPTDPTDPDSLAVLLFTSGTSGRPKAAMLTHRCLLANLEQLSQLDDPSGMTPEDAVLCVLPLFHIYALNATLGLVARQAATIVLLDRFDPASALTAVRKHHVTNVAGAPPMYVAWSVHEGLAQALSEVRLLVSGAAPLPRNVVAQYETLVGKPIWEGYGMTECSPVITASLKSGRPKAGFVGQPLAGIEVELRDADGDPVKDGDPGEIYVRGANVFSGYWPDGSGGPDDDGWFATGDVAYADADGDLRLVDRRKDLIIVSGFNVYPREVEDALLLLPGVLEVAVMGVTHPYTGEAVKAFVVAGPGSDLTPEAVLEFARTRLARFKCPTIVEIVADLPHSVTGKVSKGRLREASGVVSL
jgi:long-chain acyl-CoA synthetase